MKILLNDHLIEFIKNQSESLQHLVIDGFDFLAKDSMNLLNSKLKSLISLSVVNCNAPIQSSKALAEIVKNNRATLTNLNLSDNFLGETTKFILASLKDC